MDKYLRKWIKTCEIIGEGAKEHITSPEFIGALTIGVAVRIVRFGRNFTYGLPETLIAATALNAIAMGGLELVNRIDEVRDEE